MCWACVGLMAQGLRISLEPATTALGAAVLGALDHLESFVSSLVSADCYSFKLALSYH